MIFHLWDNDAKRKIEVESVGTSGENFTARCPKTENHKNGDQHPSLSIHPVNGYICHTCGFKGAIYNPDKLKRAAPKTVSAYYDYRSADGRLLFQKVRFIPKDFRLRRPNPGITVPDNTNPSHWTYNISAVEHVLYALPHVTASQLVYLVEGEKDADRLISLGLTATTSPFGGGKGKNKWRPEYTQQLTGKDVVLVPDNDQPGIDYMQAAGTALMPFVKSLTWLDLPGLAPKGDVSDYFAGGATLESFNALKPSVFMPTAEKPKTEKEREAEQDDITTKSLVPGLLHWTASDTGKIKYLFNEDNKLVIKDTVTIDGIVCRPKPNLAKFIFTLPAESIVNAQHVLDAAALLKEVESFIYDHVELPDNKYYLIPALWVLHTYLVAKQDTSPILYFHGLKASGKTRAGKVLAELAFRAFFLTSPREASMFRIPEAFEPTMFIDEIKILGKDGNIEVGDILKTRYERGCSVPRVDTSIKSDNDEDKIKPYSTFGPTVITTSEVLGEYLDSRSIEFLMTQNSEDRKDVERPVDKDRAAIIREKLTLFRAMWIDKDFPTFEPVARRRNGQLFNPLYQMLLITDNTDTRKAEFMEFLGRDMAAKKQLEGDTQQAEVFEKILKYMAEQGKLEFTAKDVLISINAGKENDPYKMNKNKLGRLAHAMGFDRMPNGKRVWTITDIKLKSLCDRFGMDTPTMETLPF